MADSLSSPRRAVALLLAFAFLLSACSSTAADEPASTTPSADAPVAGTIETDSIDDLPEAPVANAPLAFVDTEPAQGTISSLAPTGDEPEGPELGASPEELLAWDWGPHAPAPIAQFDAYRISGQPTTEPAWTGQFLQFSETEAASCVDGPAYQPIRAAFANTTRQTFQVDGELWQFVVLDPRTYPLAVETC